MELWLSIGASWQPIIRIYEGLCKFWQLLPAWLCVSAKREKLHCDSGVKCVTNKRKKRTLYDLCEEKKGGEKRELNKGGAF